MESNLAAPLRMFVYGSLKRGYRNHAAYCAGHASFRPATVVGRLYRQPDGYPMLVVPSSSILALGTHDLRRDMLELLQVETALKNASTLRTISELPVDQQKDWQAIRGEIYEWPATAPEHCESIVSQLDRLEDYYPADEASRAASLYHRVLVLATHEGGWELVWTFVAPGGKLPLNCTPMGRSWP